MKCLKYLVVVSRVDLSLLLLREICDGFYVSILRFRINAHGDYKCTHSSHGNLFNVPCGDAMRNVAAFQNLFRTMLYTKDY